MPERSWAKDWELCRCATPKSWAAIDNCRGYYQVVANYPVGGFVIADWISQSNAEFIAAAREALPYWLHRVQELEEENRRLKAVVEAARNFAESFERNSGFDVWFEDCWSKQLQLKQAIATLNVAREE